MPYRLIKSAYENGIVIEYYDFQNPRLEALYTMEPGYPPVIGLSKKLMSNRAHYRTVLSHELGHYFTTAKSTVTRPFLAYSDKVAISRDEYRAMVWGAKFLMPPIELEKAFSKGLNQSWELADYFCVDQNLAKLRLIYFQRERQGA